MLWPLQCFHIGEAWACDLTGVGSVEESVEDSSDAVFGIMPITSM